MVSGDYLARHRTVSTGLVFRAGATAAAVCAVVLPAWPAQAQSVMAQVDPFSPDSLSNGRPRAANGGTGRATTTNAPARDSNTSGTWTLRPSVSSPNTKSTAGGATGFDASNNAEAVRAAQRARAAPPAVYAPAEPTLTDTGRIDSRVTKLPGTGTVPAQLPAEVPAPFPQATGPIAPVNGFTRPVTRFSDKDDAYEPLGIRAGAFILKPAVEVGAGYSTNPGQDIKGRGSPQYIVAPELQVKSDWSRHELTADLRGSYTAYTEDSSLNQPALSSKINGRIDVSHLTHIDLEQRLNLSTENPGGPNELATVVNLPTVLQTGGTAGIRHQFNRLEVGGKVTFDRIAYGNSTLSDGTSSSNADRNYNQYGGELRSSYEFSPAFKPFVSLQADRREHDLAFDRFGQQRDSSAYTPNVGAIFELTKLLTGNISVGYLTRDYADPGLIPLKGIVADASLAYTYSALTTITLGAKSSGDETTLPGISGSLTRDVTLQVDHSLRRWLVATLKLDYGVDTYIGNGCACIITNAGRVDKRYAAAFALTYKLSRELYLKGELRHEERKSNVPGGDYVANAVLVGLRLQR